MGDSQAGGTDRTTGVGLDGVWCVGRLLLKTGVLTKPVDVAKMVVP
jgi:hypothetical protein